MVNYHALTSSLKLSGSNVVVLGGTQGIGAGIAIRFAELGSSVLVIGRNETAGNTVVNTMKGASADSSEAKLTFVRGDLSTVDGIHGAADDIAAWAGAQGVDYLFQTQGGPSTGVWPPTPESLTIAFNVQILSHFLIPYLLLSRPQPILRRGAQICNVGRPGEIGRAINMDDFIGIKAIEGSNIAFVKKLLSWVFIMDLYTQEFNTRFPGTHTAHAYPGNVTTNNLTHESLPWLFRCVGQVVKRFGQAPEDYADIAVWQNASDEWKAKGWAFFDHNMKEVKPDKRVLDDEALRATVWAKLLELGGAEDAS